MGFALLLSPSGQLTDNFGRTVILRGINLAGDAKLPTNPYMPTHAPADDTFFNGDNVSFVNSPFKLRDADVHFKRIKDWGFNVVRYVFTWEAIEHAGPGRYDDEFVQYTVAVLKKLKEHGIMAFMDPHQDVWSRFSGGSGSPMWTLYAAGLNPKNFKVTEAAIVQNAMDDRLNFPKMIWSTNAGRLACQVMFTLFFAGKQLAPKCILDGQNIQDYLQSHFCNAVQYLARAIANCPELANEETVIGYETLNEPSFGLIGYQDVMVLPKQQLVRIGTTPTAYQSMLLGMGFPVEVDDYYFGVMGPSKIGVKVIDPQGTIAWLPVDYDDSRYGWTRDPDWKLGECIWAQHGVWNVETQTVLKPDYFAFDPLTGELMNEDYFVNHQFMEYFIKYAATIRQVSTTTLLLLQPPVMALPPVIKNHPVIKSDTRLIYCPHYYDGLTLMNKHWNRFWNVDAVGVIREKYLTPALALRVGEKSIRNCLKSQLITFRDEGRKYVGHAIPCLISEIGIPYDMDDKIAYKTRDYSSQIRAFDANLYALERAHIHYTLWNYTVKNTHTYGDGWNGEDLSVWSLDSMNEETKRFHRTGDNDIFCESDNSGNDSDISNNETDTLMGTKSNRSYLSHSNSEFDLASPNINVPTLSSKASGLTLSITPSRSSISTGSSRGGGGGGRDGRGSSSRRNRLDRIDTVSSTQSLRAPPPPSYIAGTRAPEAFIRPAPIAVSGEILSYSFDLKRSCFRLSLRARKIKDNTASLDTANATPANDNDLGVSPSAASGRPHVASFSSHDHFEPPDFIWKETATTTTFSSFSSPNPGSFKKKTTLPTVIYLPLLHFPKGMTAVSSSSGHWEIDHDEQRLLWWHSPGFQSIQITGQLTSAMKQMGFTPPSQGHKICSDLLKCTIA